MRQAIFTLLLFFSAGLMIELSACRRDKVQPNITQYDQQQIQSYIAANGITGMAKDTTGLSAGQDTTGIWYKILEKGTGATLDYPDSAFLTYTLKSFDNHYILSDTVTDHFAGILGHLAPPGLVLAIRNIMKTKGTKARLLIPSHIAYGLDGFGSGSKTVTNGSIAGNQCLDYTINLVDNIAAYDDIVIQTYMKANNLTGYTETADGLWYKITKAPTGPNTININSDVTLNYNGRLMNNTFFDTSANTNAVTFEDLSNYTPGFVEGLLVLGRGGSSISLLVPSRLAYGNATNAGGLETIPAFSCLRFEVTVTNVVTN